MHDHWAVIAKLFLAVEAVLPLAWYSAARTMGVEPFEVVDFLSAPFLVLVSSASAAGAAAAMCVLPDSYRPGGTSGRAMLREAVGGFLIGAFLGWGLSEIPATAWIVPTRAAALACCCFVAGFAGPAAMRYAMPIGKRAMDWYAERKMPTKKGGE